MVGPSRIPGLQVCVCSPSPLNRYICDMLLHMRKQQRTITLFLLLLLTLGWLAACSPGHVGGNEIAFLRDGHLWTIDPDGANAFEVVVADTPVVGYAWSPTHQIFVYRTLDPTFANTPDAKHLVSNPVTELPGDLPSILNTIGIDGGSPIPIIISTPSVQQSNAWWNASGTRLIHREGSTNPPPDPNAANWWVSQNDQPAAIARKSLPHTFSIPSLNADSSLTIGNSDQGIFTTTLAGTNVHSIVQGTIPGHPLPAALERVLWQPAHSYPHILYALTSASSTQIHSFLAPPPAMIQLVVRDTDGSHPTTLVTCSCTQFAWSPDGNAILYSTGSTYTILTLQDGSSFSVSGEAGSVPYWSPDSQFLLLDGLHTLTLVQIASKAQKVLLSDSTPSEVLSAETTTEPNASALLQPVSNSLWASDSQHFLFLTRGRLLWQKQHLSSGKGLYTVTIDSHGQVQGSPAVVDTGNDSQAGWIAEDPNTSFLF